MSDMKSGISPYWNSGSLMFAAFTAMSIPYVWFNASEGAWNWAAGWVIVIVMCLAAMHRTARTKR